MMPNIGKRIRLSNEVNKALQTLILTHMRPIDCGDAGLRRIIRDTEPYYETWRELKWADTISVLGDNDNTKEAFRTFDRRISDVKQKAQSSPFQLLAIKGQDLIDIGIEPSPKFKDILNNLNERVVDNPELNTREFLLAIVKSEFIDNK